MNTSKGWKFYSTICPARNTHATVYLSSSLMMFCPGSLLSLRSHDNTSTTILLHRLLKVHEGRRCEACLWSEACSKKGCYDVYNTTLVQEVPTIQSTRAELEQQRSLSTLGLLFLGPTEDLPKVASSGHHWSRLSPSLDGITASALGISSKISIQGGPSKQTLNVLDGVKTTSRK